MTECKCAKRLAAALELLEELYGAGFLPEEFDAEYAAITAGPMET